MKDQLARERIENLREEIKLYRDRYFLMAEKIDLLTKHLGLKFEDKPAELVLKKKDTQ